jgi:hypothetical protein
MITPPLSCSAMPRLTREVPIAEESDWVLVGSVVDTRTSLGEKAVFRHY